MLVFDERGKPEYPGKNLSEQSREPANSIHIWHRVRKSKQGHIGGRHHYANAGQSKKLFFKINNPHSLLFHGVINPLGILGDHSKSLQIIARWLLIYKHFHVFPVGLLRH